MAYRKSGTRDPGRLQVGPRDPGSGAQKCLGGTQDPKILKWDPGLPIFCSFNRLFYT